MIFFLHYVCEPPGEKASAFTSVSSMPLTPQQMFLE